MQIKKPAEMKWVDLDDTVTQLAPLTQDVVMPWVKKKFIEKIEAV